MKPILFYLLQVIAASGLLYTYYHFALKNKKFHRYNRFYLLMTLVISCLIPFLNIPVYFSQGEAESSVVLQTLQVISSPSLSGETATISPAIQVESIRTSWFTAEKGIYLFYLLILSFFLLRVFISISKIKSIIKRNPVEQLGKIKFINTDEPGTPFSFFRWLFWNRKIELHSEKGEQIFRHELFHIQQKHSWDIILMEIVSTIFWINPFFHLVKKELKAIHEFLADEFAIKENRNWQYAELLLMQVLNTNNQLVNPFLHNQIKRRIAMITTSQKPSYRYLRKIMVLPVAAAIIFLFAFNYKNRQGDPREFEKAINSITVVIDAGHGGTDNGVKSPDGKYSESNLCLQLAQKIEELGRNYNINVILTRSDNAFPGEAKNKTEALKKRLEISKQFNPDVFISLHLNVDGTYKDFQTKSSGFEAYISDEKPSDRNISLAKSVLGELKSIYTTDPGVRQREGKGIYVLDESKVPAILLECGYINNSNDLAFISNDKSQENIAKAILKGIVTFANSAPFDRKLNLQQIAADTVKQQLKNALVIINGVVQEKRGIQNIDTTEFPKEFKGSVNAYWGKEAIDKYGEKGKDGVIEFFYDQNSNQIIDTIPKVDTIYWIKDLPPPARKSPTQAEINSWCDEKIYGVWIDSDRISNSDLMKHKPSEFGWYNVSKLTKTAVNYGKHYYQVSLYTQKYYDEKIIKNRPKILGKEIVPSDTTKPAQPLIVINDKPMPGLSMVALNKMISPNDIESMTILKDQTAIDKYGDKAKNGVLEIKVKKLNPVTQKDLITDSSYVNNTPLQTDDNKIFVKVEVEAAFPGGVTEWKKYLQINIDATVPVKNGAKAGTYTVVVQFIVHKDGRVSDVRALTNHGFGMEEEAMRLIKKGPHWIPAIQNGHQVTAYRKQPITFVIAGEISNMNETGLPLNAYLISPEESPKINLADLKKVKQLTLQKTGPVQSYELIGFRITIDKPAPDKFFKEFVIKGNNFPGELLKIIQDLDSETYITIEDIDVNIDGRKRRLPPKIYTAVSITTAAGSHPSTQNFNDQEFKRKWREMILEIKSIAWKEGKAAYIYKGRTYVFGRIINPDSTVASFTEQNGTDHVFLLNDELVTSVDELNKLIKRSDVKRFGFIKPEEALNRFNRKDPIVFIETSNEIITRN